MYDPTITEVFEAKALVGLNVSDTALNFNSINSSLAFSNSASLSTPSL